MRTPIRLLLALALLVVAPVAPAAAQTTGPTVTVSPAADLDPAGTTVTVRGTGFGTLLDGVYVRLCAAAEGETGTAAGRPNADRCLADPQHWVSITPGATATMGPDGSFTVDLAVVGVFEGSEGDLFDCRRVTCGIATRRDHVGGSGDYSLDTFTPVTFRGTADDEPVVDDGPATPPPAPTDGALDWGVKRSFRSYVSGGAARGEIATVEPASTNPDGTFRFAGAGEADFGGEGDVDAAHAGAVRFTGHDGALDLTIADPRVRIDGDDGTLVVDADGTHPDTGLPQRFDDIVLATLDASAVQATATDGLVTWRDVTVTLTEDGSEAFGGFYQAGEVMDPLTLVVEADDTGDIPAPGAGDEGDGAAPPDDAVTCLPTAPVAAGAEVEVCASGFTPGEQVQLFLHSDPIFLDVVTASTDGAVAAAVRIPADAAAGPHRIELRAVSSGRSLMSDPFTVTGSASPAGGSTLPVTGGSSPLLVALAIAVLALTPRFWQDERNS